MAGRWKTLVLGVQGKVPKDGKESWVHPAVPPEA